MLALSRPMPPPEVVEGEILFARSMDVEGWLREAFIDPAGPLHADRHLVLEDSAQAGGGPMWTTSGHDFEEFDDVVEDFGPDVLGGGARRMIEAAAAGPRIAAAQIRLACGNCLSGGPG